MGIGLVQGRHVGTIVLDFDGELGLETLAGLEAKGLPQGIRQFTPRGGVHVMLGHPGIHIPTRKNVLPGMDIRGDGGFIVAAPSIGANGRPYAWDADAHPEEAPLADVPAWLVPTIAGPVATAPGEAGEVIRAPVPGSFGLMADLVTDGREQYMRDTILAVCRDLRDSLRRLPTAEELTAAAWAQYSARVDFTRPGRSYAEFEAKARYTLARASVGLVKGFTAEPIPEGVQNGKSAIWIDGGAWDEAAIPKRPWIAPSYLMRNAVSCLSGQGSGGKSSLVVAWTVYLALGEPVGEFRPARPCVVVNYNVEDDEQEQQRRYSAALKAVGKSPSDIAGKVIRCGPRSIGTLFERDNSTGRIAPTKAMEALESLLMETNADVLVCDPLAELHNAEENDNTAMRSVIAAFRGMAQLLGIAILILHHDRKGNNAPGDMDRLRGASAITGAVRVLLTLTSMSQEECDKMGVDPAERRRHFRIDGAKSNYALAQEAEWWRLAGYELGNGETVAACRPWSPPGAMDGLSMAQCVSILGFIDKGIGGCPYGSNGKGKRELMDAILAQFGDGLKLTEGRVNAILASFLAGGALAEKSEQPSPNSRHKRSGYIVNDAVVAKMRHQTGGSTNDD